MNVERLVVVGASLAGLRAVEAARAAGWDGDITLVGAESHLPYDRPPLSKAFLDSTDDLDPKPFKTEAELTDGLDVNLMLGTPATSLHPQAKTVEVGGGTVSYDSLIVATGAYPRMFAASDDLDGVHSLRSADDAIAVRAALNRGARTVVIGAGFIGSEVASAARKRGIPATIIERELAPLSRALGKEPGAICTDLHRDAGTHVRLGATIHGLESQDGHVTGVRLDSGEVIDAELVVVGIGVIPATAWLGGAVDLHPADSGILCDATLATSAQGVWAAGDVAHFPNVMFDDDVMRLEHWTNAAEQGALAAHNALGLVEPKPLSTVPYFWSDWYGHRIQFVGTPKSDEVRVIGEPGPGVIVLYRRGERLVGTMTLDRPRDIMKFRRHIVNQTSWCDVVADAHQRADIALAL